MSKAPAFQLYVRDWLSDPQLRAASTSTKGIWIDLLCFMWEAPDRGKLVDVTLCQLAKMTGATTEEITLFLSEAKALNFACVTDRDKNITVENRRMVREEKARKDNAERQLRFRQKKQDLNNAPSNEKVTSLSSSSSSNNKITVQIPTWIDPSLWDDFKDHRRRLRKPMTTKAETLLIGKIEKLKDQGFDPKELLETAIERGWQTVFPPQDRNGKTEKPKPEYIHCPECGISARPHEIKGGKCPACGCALEAK